MHEACDIPDLAQMSKRRHRNAGKEPPEPGPKAAIQARMPEALAADIKEAADLIGKSVTGFIRLAAGEYAKNVIEIHRANPELDHNEILFRAFTLIATQRSTFSRR